MQELIDTVSEVWPTNAAPFVISVQELPTGYADDPIKSRPNIYLPICAHGLHEIQDGSKSKKWKGYMLKIVSTIFSVTLGIFHHFKVDDIMKGIRKMFQYFS